MSSPVPQPEFAGPRIKGSGVQPFLAWYAATWGEGRLARHATWIPTEYHSYVHVNEPLLGVLPSAWYPAPAIHAILDAVEVDHSPEERATIVRDGARAIIDATLTGVYRWLFQTMMTPDRYARNSGRLFSRYYEPGVMTKTKLGATGHLTTVDGWGAHHPILCEFLVHTAAYVYGQLGCRDLNVRRTACVRNGDADCRFEVTWS
jgi:hypothetical protein